jgi:glycosyltransferase involved in cell wall biosynthesis/predicted SAM-dependent methyltransferase
LGCGPHIIADWDNLDLDPGPGGMACDLTKGLPYESNSVDNIFSEHFIEHISRKDALFLLGECNRVLKPGGHIRVSTPDLFTSFRDFLTGRLDRWASVGFLGNTPCEHLNAGLREWGHTFVYDWKELELLFNQAGLRNIDRKPVGKSDVAQLSGRESRPYFDDLIIEAEKAAVGDNPRISVVMASFNHEQFVGQAIESVLTQTLQDFEFCITDDGSSDGTCEVIRRYSDRRIKFVELGSNHGACYAINHAIRRSSAPYIAIINSDDRFYPSKLEKQLAVLASNSSVGAVFSDVDFVDENNAPLADTQAKLGDFTQVNRSRQDWLARLYVGGNCLAHPSVLIRRSCYLWDGFYDERFRQLPDYLMWIRILKRWNFHIIPEPLIAFRQLAGDRNESARSPGVERRGLWEMTQIAKELMGFEDSDFKHVVRSVMPHATDDYIAMRTREMVFSEMALQMKCTAHIQAAVELIYESFPRAGSGGDFHPLKWPSILASIVSHNGFTLMSQP